MAKKRKSATEYNPTETILMVLIWAIALWPLIQWGLILDPFTYTQLNLQDTAFNGEHVFKMLSIVGAVILIMGWFFFIIDYFCENHTRKK